MLSKSEQKCENFAIFKQSNTLKLFVAIKWPIRAVSAWGEISIFQNSSKTKGLILFSYTAR